MPKGPNDEKRRRPDRERREDDAHRDRRGAGEREPSIWIRYGHLR